MAKGNNDPTRENDYLEQLQWRANHRRSVPVRFEPKWKYKVVYRNRPASPIENIIQWILLIGIVAVILLALSSFFKVGDIGSAVGFGAIFLLAGIILVFALRDGSKRKKDKSDDLDS